MIDNDGAQLADGSSPHLRQLSLRAQVVARRLRRFEASGWDINGLELLRGEALVLGRRAAELNLDEAGAHLRELARLIASNVEREELPELPQAAQLLVLADALELTLPIPDPEPAAEPDFGSIELDLVAVEAAYGEAAPPDETVDAAPTSAAAEAEPEIDIWGESVALFSKAEAPSGAGTPRAVVTTPPIPTKPAASAPMVPSTTRAAPITQVPASAPTAPTARAAAPAAPATRAGGDTAVFSVPPGFRIYHLSGYGPLSLDLDQRFETLGLEIELLDDVAELNELLSALPADLVLIDACFAEELESVGSAVRLARASSNKQRLRLVAISEQDDITLRLTARRAGVDALIVAPADANDVLRRLQALVDPEREENFRILIVEDDRSQALFAEGILRNAGMDSLVVIDALDVMPALKNFRPDLILMDLNMPGANGIELTALIREQEAFAHTPIVFLSGEASEDLQFDAIDAGGDDFLSKPIRPRHLISAVQTRVRRHRQQENRRVKRPDKDAATGLVYRKTLLEQLDEALAQGSQAGGLIFLEVESLGLLRERIGLTALEILLGDVSRLLTTTAGELPTTRFGDGSWLLIDRRREELALDSLATELRAVLMQNAFQALGHPLRLRLSVGVCAFRHSFSDSGAMINAVEKVAREARTHERGVRRFEPPRANEAVKEAALLELVRDAIDRDSLVLLYQPVVAVAGSDTSQYQVLLRLRDASGKLRSAAEVIPMAERTSLIVEIDRWVMLHSLALIRERLELGQQLRLFVTQSPLTLAAPGQAEWLRKEILGAGIPGDSVVLELRLEDAAVHVATVRQFCDAMAPLGVQFCLSQFEAGADAEILANQLPLSFVKLARNYTAGSLSPALRDELKTIIGRAHQHRLQVIGHCVEDAQSAATLWMSGIDFIQGNLVQQADPGMNFDFNQAVL
jgi:EAL domain-containing protein (putative c-di-GMP-specific phosphodiesterase class I)/DNA-binding response OmpR family regulator